MLCKSFTIQSPGKVFTSKARLSFTVQRLLLFDLALQGSTLCADPRARRFGAPLGQQGLAMEMAPKPKRRVFLVL